MQSLKGQYRLSKARLLGRMVPSTWISLLVQHPSRLVVETSSWLRTSLPLPSTYDDLGSSLTRCTGGRAYM